MYVCMYVCMHQAVERVCMYVSLILGSPKPSKFINMFDPSPLLILVRKSLQSMDKFAQNEIRTQRTIANPIDISNFLVLDYKFIY